MDFATIGPSGSVYGFDGQ